MDVEKQMTCPLLESSTSSNLVQRPSLSSLRHVPPLITTCTGVFYFCLLVFLVLCLAVVYVPRVFVCCIRYRVSSYQCNNSVFMVHDMELEMAYLTTQNLVDLFCLAFLVRWHRSSGLKCISRKLVRLAKFWNIVAMMLISGCYMIIMLNRTVHLITTPQYFVLFLSSLHCIFMALFVPVLNYTKISLFSKVEGHSKFHGILIKLTLFAQFVVNVSMFWLVCIQLGFSVSGVDSKAKGTLEFQTMLLILKDSTLLLFHYTVQSFLWHKLFEDDRNLLAYMEKLAQ